MIYLKRFSELSKNDAAIAGGKGASLGEMARVGIPVPPGFVVLASTFDNFLELAGIDADIDAIISRVNHQEIHTVEQASKEIQAIILNSNIPKEIELEIKTEFKNLDAKYVAVRSSATAEDSSAAAWAGQLDSFLNTTESTLLENVKRCWASLFNPRAIFYRFEKKMHNQKISVAVVVQKMVESAVSGIAFSVHPVTEDRNQIIIEAGFGLGEAIVSGQVTPDSYVVSKKPFKILDKNVSTQEKGIYRHKSNQGSDWQTIPKIKGEGQCLTDKEILELSELIIRIENHYGFPCDIEWAKENNEFYIVQSRPITTLQSKNKENKGEVDSGNKINISRLAATKWHYVHRRFRTPFYSFILFDGASKHYNKEFGFQYEVSGMLNLDNELMFSEDGWNSLRILAERTIKENPNSLMDAINLSYSLNREIEIFGQNIKNCQSFAGNTNDELLEIFNKYIDYSLRASAFMVYPILFEQYLETEIKKSIKLIFKGDDIIKAEQLFTSSVKLSCSQDEEISLLNLAQKKISNKLEHSDVLGHMDKYSWIKNVSMDGQFYTYDEIIEKIDLRVKDDPVAMLKFLKQKRNKFLKDLEYYKIKVSKDKKLIIYIDTLQEAIFFRSWRTERMYKNIQYFYSLLSEIANRLKVLNVNDILFLLPPEIISLLSLNCRADNNLIKERKKGFILFAAGTQTYISSGLILLEAKNKIKFLESDTNDKNTLLGQKAYPGKINGIVSLILEKSDFSKMQKGNILVCHSTTPDYLPVIHKSSAIVTDEGGVLSHASIISRELHKPCVIGTKFATQVLHNGDEIEVDANNGVVKIIKKK